MAMDINKSVVGTSHSDDYADPTTGTDFYGGGSLDTDSVKDLETSWMVKWAQWHAYYNDVPVFAEVMDVLALWTVGKGYKADEKVKKVLNRITGWGKDDFNTIIENLLRVCLICGDSYAEIIRDKAGRLINLKPLNPGTIKIIINPKGMIKRYEQIINSKIEKFKPKEIFHLCWNRLADEIHGKPMAQRQEPIIKQIKQLTEDLGLRFHRIVKPVRLYEADTDDATKLSAVEVKLKQGYQNCEFIVIPKGTLEAKDVAAIPNAQDAIEFLNNLLRQFVTSCACPEVILGWSVGTTDAAAKIVYLSFQQPTERKQKFLEEQIRLQLGLELNFEFPASLEPVTKTAGDVTSAPSNRPPADDGKKEGKLNNVMKK